MTTQLDLEELCPPIQMRIKPVCGFGGYQKSL